jgi:hypothetical protein
MPDKLPQNCRSTVCPGTPFSGDHGLAGGTETRQGPLAIMEGWSRNRAVGFMTDRSIMLRRKAIAAVCGTVLSSAIVVLAPVNQADAASCTSGRNWTYTWAAYSRCTGTAHRAYAVCKTSPNNSVDTYVGPWVGSGQTSTVICPGPTISMLYYGSDLPD